MENSWFKNIKNVKKCERIKFPTLTKYSDSFITSLPIYYNVLDERIDLTGMTGMVIDDEQSNIQIRLDDDKYKEDLYHIDNCVTFSFPEDKEYENLTVEVIDPGGFICPECGSKEAGEHMMASKEPLTEKNKKDPWASILQQTECASCKNIIPDHLGDRWDNMSIEEAQKEWKEIYRKTSRFQKL